MIELRDTMAIFLKSAPWHINLSIVATGLWLLSVPAPAQALALSVPVGIQEIGKRLELKHLVWYPRRGRIPVALNLPEIQNSVDRYPRQHQPKRCLGEFRPHDSPRWFNRVQIGGADQPCIGAAGIGFRMPTGHVQAPVDADHEPNPKQST